MYAVNFIIDRLGLQWLIDAKVKNHISGVLADLSITAAIASMPIRAVMAYMLPILLISALGFVLIYFIGRMIVLEQTIVVNSAINTAIKINITDDRREI